MNRVAKTTVPPAVAARSTDPAVYFRDREDAERALEDWAADRDALEDRRDPVVRGALRVMPAHGGTSSVHRITGLSRSTVDRINCAAPDAPAVTEDVWIDLDLWVWILREQVGRLQAAASGESDPRRRGGLLVESAHVESLAELVGNLAGDDDAELQRFAASLRRHVGSCPAGGTPVDPIGDRVYADAADLVTQLRLHGDSAFDALDPDLVAQARARRDRDHLRTAARDYGRAAYYLAILSRRPVHGTWAADAAARNVYRRLTRKSEVERRIAELRAELDQLTTTNGLVEDMENDVIPGTVGDLRRIVGEDPDLAQALSELLDPEPAARLLATALSDPGTSVGT